MKVFNNSFRTGKPGLSLFMVIIMAFICCGLFCASAIGATTVKKTAGSQIVEKCKADLAKRLGVQAKDITVVDVKNITWPDASLGMPEIGKTYAKVKTPGSRLILRAENTDYLYTAGAKAFKYGGPVALWSNSMLYIKPVKNDVNFNGDLYQCSLLGTNNVRLFSEVADFYPQDKGLIVVKRRMSRSTHDLLYFNADKPGKGTLLYHGFDMSDVSVNGAQNLWAGYVRPGLGETWVLVVNGMSEDTSKIKVIPLPDGVWPTKVKWSEDDEKVMILVRKEGKDLAFEMNPRDEKPAWVSIGTFSFPGQDSFMLNKSESLEIGQVDPVNGKPMVEVARVWFTGDRNVVAKISDFTMTGYDLIGGNAFIWGTKNSHPAVYTVDINSGNTVSSYLESADNIKPFLYPAKADLLMLKKTK